MTETLPVVIFQWSGEAMVPRARFHNLANAHYVVGELYRLEAIEERSAVSHRHYFACIHDAWLNIPEHLADRFPTSEALRKFALIKTGYADERSIVCATKAEAQRVAAFVKPMDTYAVVAVSEAVVTVYTAKSQSMKAMGRKVFQESKDAVLGYVADLIGVTPDALAQRKREAA
jgi:hypothetical protein